MIWQKYFYQYMTGIVFQKEKSILSKVQNIKYNTDKIFVNV